MTGGNSCVYSTASDPIITRSARVSDPMHLKFEIEAYQELVELHKRAGYESITSTEFTATGHTWALVIYPTGNTKDNGQDHVSIYVRLVDKLPEGKCVYSSFKFFIRDYENEKYKIIQDGVERCFDADHCEWGISKAIKLQAFLDEKNGLLVNDCCTFGVEVYVANQIAKTSSLFKLEHKTSRLEKKTASQSYTWPMYDFSTIVPYASSPNFDIGNRTWTLRLYPKGYMTGFRKCLSVYLYLNKCDDLTEGNKLYAEFEFKVKDQVSGNDYKKTVGFWFEQSTDHGACDELIPLSDLNNPMTGFRQDDRVIIEVTVSKMFMLGPSQKTMFVLAKETDTITKMFMLGKKAYAPSWVILQEAKKFIIFVFGILVFLFRLARLLEYKRKIALWFKRSTDHGADAPNPVILQASKMDPLSARITQLEQDLDSFKQKTGENMEDLTEKLDQIIKNRQ
ncbi:hypothetical protein Ancab_028433 [Ancistrocladus abbreviatus]